MSSLHSHYHQSFDGTTIFLQSNVEFSELKKQGYVCIFNYGLVCNNNHWIYQTQYFTEKKIPFIIHDYRGHFNSSPNIASELVTFGNICRDISSFISELELNPKNLVLLGHSMGVNICLEYLRSVSDEIIGSVMISGTVAPPHEVMFDSNIFEFISPLAKTIKKKFPRIYQGIWSNSGKIPLVQKWVHEGGFNTGKVDLEFIQQYVNKIGKLDPNIFFQCLEEMRRQNSSIYLHEIKTPTLVIAGDKDKVIPFHVQVELHQKLKNSKLYVVGEGSHVPQVDFPESVNDAIADFILRLTT